MQTLNLTTCRLIVIGVLALSAGCGRNEADYQKMLHENERLKAEVDAAKQGKGVSDDDRANGKATPADLDLDINTLWTQRYEDNEFRSKQRLTDKIIRVTGVLDGVTESSVSLLGDSKRFGNVRMTVNFSPAYAARSQAGLASLERGLAVTVQGKFVYERTSLTDAIFVDRKSGKQLSSNDIAAIARDRPVEKSAAQP